MRQAVVLVLTLGIALTSLPYRAGAQGQPGVRDMTDETVTSEKLIEHLKPTGPALKTRGLGAVGGKTPCEFRRKQGSRGIGLASEPAPVAEAVAIKVEFAFNSAELSPQASKTLDELGKALASADLQSCCFEIEGHTDSIGSDAYNLKLSERRAQSVVRYLTQRFKLDPDRLQAVGMGKAQPIADNSTDAGRQKNRRVQVVNLGFGATAAQ